MIPHASRPPRPAGRRPALAVLALALIAFAPQARADETSEALERAQKLYGSGDLKGAAKELAFAARDIDLKRRTRYAKLFPPAPKGWSLAEMEKEEEGSALATQMLGGGVMVERTYTRASDDAEIKAQVMVDSPLVQSLASVASNPMMMRPGDKRVRLGEEDAILHYEADNKSGEVTLVGGNLMIKLEGSGIEDPKLMTDLLGAFDLKKLRGGG
ncbi:hypothetical protein MVG78_17205 [Roseomonas gilardii subsp. gilardii]|uniref:hypothetical protein n=1 Tax=Roseomonas gilardii TaxID=257708 RepID=UPI001FF8C1DB|nr:hypothetical protein [Roseomonas gilardii]UPG72232.1 hypothetical protein MVG78_17205 [Roseomonas gilardii subsp. gilardii]